MAVVDGKLYVVAPLDQVSLLLPWSVRSDEQSLFFWVHYSAEGCSEKGRAMYINS